MFNSVTKYLWGGADNESDYTDQHRLQEGHQMQDGENRAVAVVEHDQEDDWLLVGNADKENSNLPVQHHHYHNQLHNHPHVYHHHHSHHSSHDSLSQQSSEVELLDDAASLVRDIADPCGRLPLLDCDKSMSDQEDNGLDSGVRPSSPESVFSACSGRSSATYRPRGVDSEAWIVAPPPCFTGSQCGSLSPVVASPLENLLIEHPSMSVYISQPASVNSQVSTESKYQVLHSVLHISESSANIPETAQTGNEAETVADTAALSGRLDDAVHPRSRGETVVHQHHLSVEKVQKSQQNVQRKALCNAQKSFNKQKCNRQNKVRQINSTSKGRINHKNKQLRPSGFKSSRTPQRFVPQRTV